MKANDIWNIQPLAAEGAVIQGRNYRITVLTERLLRLEFDADGQFRDTATQKILCRHFEVPDYTVREEDHRLILDTQFLHLSYDRKPFSSTGLSVTLKGVYHAYCSIWHYSDTPDTLGGTARTLDEADGAVPLEDGIQSIQGYAVLDDSRSMGMDEDGNLTDAWNRGIDLYFFGYGRDYRSAMQDYLRLCGPVPPIPRFALGNWWSRFFPYTQDEYRCLMERFEKENIPLSVSVLDMNWHTTAIDPKYGTGWTGYTWDHEKFPDPEKLIRWLHDHGLHVTLNDHPADGVRPCEALYAGMAEAMGDDPEDSRSYPFDAADRKWQKAFEAAILDPLEKEGVDFWWIDWQQKGGSSDPGMDPLFVLNHTRYLHALHKGLPALILSRYAGPGSHRYPLGFSGDTCITWASLAFQPYFTATAANIGYTWWSHDIGGHMHGSYDPELTVRWVQFGVFSPVLRLHSSNSIFLEKEPWTFPVEKSAILGGFLRLRHRLIPWLYSQNLLCSEKGEMLLRPLYYDIPNVREAYALRNQYMLGDCMTVNPVTSPVDRNIGVARTDTYIPQGTWTDFFTGQRYEGGGTVSLYRSLNSIPVLVRAGSILPMDGNEVPKNGAPVPDVILLRVFPGAGCETIIIEDNGKMPQDPGYTCCRTHVQMEDGETVTLRIHPPEGDLSLIPISRQYVIEINGTDRVPDMSCPFTYDFRLVNRTLTLYPEMDWRKGATLTWPSGIPIVPPDNKGCLCELLRKSEISFDLKEAVMSVISSTSDPAVLLARLHALSLSPVLYGAMAEIISAL